MELKFTKDAQSGNWVSEYEAKAGFNLHIEGAKKLRLYQRTAGSRYDEIEGEYKDGAYSFDYDFDALVYPKYIKIVSETEPTYAEVVSDGEITEIKSQTKEVEVTANGTTQVAPDAGYSYLTGVTVKTNVPQSGGGIVEDENTRVIKGNDFYWRMPAAEETIYKGACLMLASGFEYAGDVVYEGILGYNNKKIIVGGARYCGLAGMSVASNNSMHCIAFRERAFTATNGQNFSSIAELLMAMQGFTEENALAYMTQLGFTRITEEEFYNLES